MTTEAPSKAPKLEEDKATKLEASNYEIHVARSNLELNTFQGHKDRNTSTVVTHIDAIMKKFPVLPAHSEQSVCTMHNLALLLADKKVPYYISNEHAETYMDKQAVLLGIVIARVATVLFCMLKPLEHDKEKDSSREVAFLHPYAFHHVNVFNHEMSKYAREAVREF
jgi:hypothetical protein